MFGLLGDADASTDSAASDIISTIGSNITDAVSQAASSASEFFPDLVHGSLRGLQTAGSGSGSGHEAGGGGHTPAWIPAIAIIGFIGLCALGCWAKKKCKLKCDCDCLDYKHNYTTENPLFTRVDTWGNTYKADAHGNRVG